MSSISITAAPSMVVPVLEGYWDDYLWIVVCAGLASFFMAWGIGANDVANSFATSVGSKTLKLWQACIVAAVFEFTGALALGGETTKTIASDIADTSMFQSAPEIYMYGMLCSLAVAGVWLLVATYYCYAVSTTHSIIGAIMGFSLVYGGWNGVQWNTKKGDFPYSKGFLPVVLSWFFSPIVGGILAAIIFFFNRLCILRRKHSTLLAIWSLPFLVFLTIFINIMFVLAKGAKSEMQKEWPCTTAVGKWDLTYSDCSDLNNAAAWIAACAGAGCALICGLIFIPFLLRRWKKDLADAETAANRTEAEQMEVKVKEDAETTAKEEAAKVRYVDYQIPEDIRNPLMIPVHYSKKLWYMTRNQVLRGIFFDVHETVVKSDAVAAMHQAAEVFDPHTEKVYQLLQVFSACCIAFAHGSNDVANSIGPFSAIYYTYQNYQLPGSNTETPKWIFAFGGVGIVAGLLMYGYNIIAELGVTMLKLTPSRGFSVELAAGLTISLASFYGIPVSTTQIIVGCEWGAGLTESLRTGINFRTAFKTFCGWIWTIIIALGFCACLFSMGAYAPCIIQANEIQELRQGIFQHSMATYAQLNGQNLRYRNNTEWWRGNVSAPMPWNGSVLNSTIASQSSQLNKAYNKVDSKGKNSGPQHVGSDTMIYFLNSTRALYNNYSMLTIGQNNASAIRDSEAWVNP